MDATFSGPPFDDEHPPGEPLARHVQAELAARGWDVDEVDSWRDSGWFFACKRGASELEVIIAAMEKRWALQIGPLRGRGLLARMFGRSPSASPSEIYELAMQLHEVLAANGSKEFAWSATGPVVDGCPPEPPPPELPRATLRK